eukprot:TRINITY_DN8214_c1_g1_i1.p1 TRINITY_DN8214_c1_g1~~TRINITY_DN8214_c1_g1_i1.p1  ORF type:complete len:357 (+),score=55.92 TRINITY_DN8214_c1_g1_i1:112-1182(+)
MGACHDKEVYIVCSFGNDEIRDEKQRQSRTRDEVRVAANGNPHTFTFSNPTTSPMDVDPRVEVPFESTTDAAAHDGREIPVRSSAEVECRTADLNLVDTSPVSGNAEKKTKHVGFAAESSEKTPGGHQHGLSPLQSPYVERKSGLPFTALQSRAFEPKRKITLGDIPRDESEDSSVHEIAALILNEPLHLSTEALQWATDFEDSRLEEVRTVCEGALRLKLCIRLTSGSLNFQVVSAVRKMSWRLYPRCDGASRVPAAGFQLLPGLPDAIGVALGDDRIGTSSTFSIVECVGTIVTVWVEVPVSVASNGNLDISASPEASALGFRVWYTKEDTGVRLEIGDGVDVSQHLLRQRTRS